MIHRPSDQAFCYPRARLQALLLSMMLALSPTGPAMAADAGPEPAERAAPAKTADADAAEPAAGNAEADPENADADPENAEADAENAEADAEAGGESPEVFIPTEEISEDFAVSFPVDI